MKHEELLEMFTDYEAHFDQVRDEDKVFGIICAVIELHKPMHLKEHRCDSCLEIYPCATIELVKKALK